MKILVIEDDEQLRNSITKYLRSNKNIVEEADSFSSGEDKIELYSYDLVILDIGLPDGTGIDLLEIIKGQKSDVGVLILSAKDSLEDRVSGLDLGADDYMTKPFHLSELNSRLKSIYRRRFSSGNDFLEFNEYKLDTKSNTVFINKTPIDLSKKEYDLLLYFITNARRVLTKTAIAEHLWGDHMDMLDSKDIIYTHIKNLRKKLLNYAAQDYITTVYGMGYKWTDRI